MDRRGFSDIAEQVVTTYNHLLSGYKSALS